MTPATPSLPGAPLPTLGPQPGTRDFDSELKELDVLSKQQELDAKKQELAQKSHWSARWNNPVVLAALAALVGYLGTLITWTLARSDDQARHTRTLELEEAKHQATEQLEQKKLQGTLILDAMKTGDEKRAAANLLLLADAKLIAIDAQTRKTLEQRRGEVGPGLPRPVQTRAEPERDLEHFLATFRRDARTSVADAEIISYDDLDALLNKLPKDEAMQKHEPPIGATSERVIEENQNVSVKVCFLYAFKREASNDYHLIIGNNKTGQKTRFLSAFISGLPSDGPFRDQLQTPRMQFRHVVGEPSTRYLKLHPPLQVQITGSLFYNTSHQPGMLGPTGLKPATAWRIQPVTDIIFKP